MSAFSEVTYRMGDTPIFSIQKGELDDYRKYIGHNEMSDDDILGNYFLRALTMAGMSLKDVSIRGLEPVLKDLRDIISRKYDDVDAYFFTLIHSDILRACKEKGVEYEDGIMLEYLNHMGKNGEYVAEV